MKRLGGFPRTAAGDPVATEAAAWAAQYHLGTIDEAGFQLWRDKDPRHALAFARVLAASETPDVGAREATVPQRPGMAATSRRGLLRAAGLVATASVFGGGFVATRAYAWSSDSTAVGENKKVRLPDGSIAALNTDSRLSWRFSAGERVLRVDRGEVALDLRAGPEVMVRGEGRNLFLSEGRFDLRLRDAALDLLVLHGRARVGAGDAGAPEALIDAREGRSSVLVSRDAAAVRRVNGEQIEGITAWQQSEILFRDATLGSAVEEYNRFLTRKIVIVDRELSTIPVGGRFTTTDPSAFLQAVSTGLNIRVSRSANAYFLTR